MPVVYVQDSLVQRGKTSWRMSCHPVFEDGSRGERTFITLPNCRLKREAKNAASRVLLELGELANAKEAEEADPCPTLIEYAETLTSELRFVGAIGETAARNYVSSMRSFGDCGYQRMDEITPEDVRYAIHNLLEDGLSPNTINSGLGTMKRMFRFAIEDGVVRKSPCSRIPAPAPVPTKPRSLTEEEKFTLILAIERLAGFLPLAAKMGLTLGNRGEEACGYRWTDLDDIARKLSVNRAVVTRKGGGVLVKVPKTPTSFRTLPLEEDLYLDIVARREWQQQKCLMAGVKWSRSFYILGDIDGQPLDPQKLRRAFAEFCDALGLECRYHWLRHTFATNMFNNGEDAKTVAGWLGHLDPGFTMRTYVDLDPAKLVESLSSVKKALTVPEGFNSSLMCS